MRNNQSRPAHHTSHNSTLYPFDMITTMTNDSYSTDSSVHIVDETVGCGMTGLQMTELSSTRKVKFSCQATFMTLGPYATISSQMKPMDKPGNLDPYGHTAPRMMDGWILMTK